MAVDRKADYVGNHGGAYTDVDGQSRQFTYIDHDKKTKISRERETKEEKQKRKDLLKAYKQQEIEFILSRPAIFWVETGNTFAEEYVKRDENDGLIWDEKYVRSALDINDEMRSLIHRAVSRENTWSNNDQAEKFRLLEYEDFCDGKWKEFI